MSKQISHTPEPWRTSKEFWPHPQEHLTIYGKETRPFYTRLGIEERTVALVTTQAEDWHDREEGDDTNPHAPEVEANARRIVACVNACAGIPVEQLEAPCPATNPPAVKRLAASVFAFLADFPDYDGPTFREAREALRASGYPVQEPEGRESEDSPRSRLLRALGALEVEHPHSHIHSADPCETCVAVEAAREIYGELPAPAEDEDIPFDESLLGVDVRAEDRD
jgi:hypothetical protein